MAIVFVFIKWQTQGRFTSVGHEDLQRCVLKQEASGEHRSDLAEHPFAVKPLGVDQHLRTGERKEIR